MSFEWTPVGSEHAGHEPTGEIFTLNIFTDNIPMGYAVKIQKDAPEGAIDADGNVTLAKCKHKYCKVYHKRLYHVKRRVREIIPYGDGTHDSFMNKKMIWEHGVA